MPYSSHHVDAEVLLRHGGVTIHRIYKDDDVDQGARAFWFTTNPNGSDRDGHGEGGTFDVRQLETDVGQADVNTVHGLSSAIVAAIDSGEITPYDADAAPAPPAVPHEVSAERLVITFGDDCDDDTIGTLLNGGDDGWVVRLTQRAGGGATITNDAKIDGGCLLPEREQLGVTFRLFDEVKGEPFGEPFDVALSDIVEMHVY